MPNIEKTIGKGELGLGLWIEASSETPVLVMYDLPEPGEVGAEIVADLPLPAGNNISLRIATTEGLEVLIGALERVKEIMKESTARELDPNQTEMFI